MNGDTEAGAWVGVFTIVNAPKTKLRVITYVLRGEKKHDFNIFSSKCMYFSVMFNI